MVSLYHPDEQHKKGHSLLWSFDQRQCSTEETGIVVPLGCHGSPAGSPLGLLHLVLHLQGP